MKIKLSEYIDFLKRAFTDPPVLPITFTVTGVPCLILSIILLLEGNITAVIVIWFSVGLTLLICIVILTVCWLYDEIRYD